jgi:hypothetical protein
LYLIIADNKQNHNGKTRFRGAGVDVPPSLRKQWRRADGPRRAECAGEFACAAPFRFYFSYSELSIKLFFLAAIFSEPEGFCSVYTPALTGRHFYLVCSGKEFRKHSARRVPSARRHRLPFPKKIYCMRKALPEIPNTVTGTFFCEKR